jgi:hypothetical protein
MHRSWCDRTSSANGSTPASRPGASLAACKYCKCRACRACRTPTLPKWATSSIKGVRASCALFGYAICNSTGQLGETVARVQAAAYARWQFNHTRQWIDALFATSYRAEGVAYAAMLTAGGSAAAPRMVEAEEGLAEADVLTLRESEGNASTWEAA